MEVRLSETISYCPGVEKAIKLAELVLETARARGVGAYCIGSLVHNKGVQDDFAARGMVFIDSPQGHAPGEALVSAHGIPEALRREFQEAGFHLVDGTCSKIVRNVGLIKRKAGGGRFLVVIGIPGHSETRCLMGAELFPGVPVPSALVASEADLDSIPEGIPLFVIAQTTVKREVFERLSSLVTKRFEDVEVHDSLCAAPLMRQRHLLELCGSCEAVVVVGGARSANTLALADLAASRGVRVFRVEKPEELPPEVFSFQTVGIAAGSSTPRAQLDAVAAALEQGEQPEQPVGADPGHDPA